MDITAILSTVLFVGPGFFINYLEDQFWATSNKDKKYENYILESFIYSILILVLNLLFLKLIFNIKILTFGYLILKLNDILFFIKYILLINFSSLLTLWISRMMFKLKLNIQNRNESKNKAKKYTIYPTVWDKIFNNDELNINELVISISKGGVIISQGFLSSHSRLNADLKEIELFCTRDVEDYLNDKEFVTDNLEDIDFEYYDINNDILIKGLRFKEGAFNSSKVEEVF